MIRFQVLFEVRCEVVFLGPRNEGAKEGVVEPGLFEAVRERIGPVRQFNEPKPFVFDFSDGIGLALDRDSNPVVLGIGPIPVDTNDPRATHSPAWDAHANHPML